MKKPKTRKLGSFRILIVPLSLIIIDLNFIITPNSGVAHAQKTTPTSKQDSLPSPPESVKGRMQTHPGGPLGEVEVAVHAVPVDVPAVEATRATLNASDLVLGVVIDGQAMAYPIRYLAMHEIVDDRVGSTPVAPTW